MEQNMLQLNICCKLRLQSYPERTTLNIINIYSRWFSWYVDENIFVVNSLVSIEYEKKKKSANLCQQFLAPQTIPTNRVVPQFEIWLSLLRYIHKCLTFQNLKHIET